MACGGSSAMYQVNYSISEKKLYGPNADQFWIASIDLGGVFFMISTIFVITNTSNPNPVRYCHMGFS